MGDELSLPTPAAELLRGRVPWLWVNPSRRPMSAGAGKLPLGPADLHDAEARWDRFAPLLAELFDELRPAGGLIESDLLPVPRLATRLAERDGVSVAGRLLVKADHALPVAGSVKARGGTYAVLHFAERLALAEGLLAGTDDDYRTLATPAARARFADWTLSVASTGNLGLSIGLAGAALGFGATVHMSAEAKEWKKRRLRDLGVSVVEHASDYIAAGAAARAEARNRERIHFIDDENSIELFLGYSVAAIRLGEQLSAAGIRIDREHPLVLYLPCGVGGAPGGITFGARCVFGDNVHCFFAEPVEAPCVLLGLLTGRGADVSVYDAGLTGRTEADGLAVSRCSGLVGRLMAPLLDGCYTVTDERLSRLLVDLYETEAIEVEPSAAAGAAGPEMLLGTATGKEYLHARELTEHLDDATHVIWTTGGSLVPPEEHQAHRRRA